MLRELWVAVLIVAVVSGAGFTVLRDALVEGDDTAPADGQQGGDAAAVPEAFEELDRMVRDGYASGQIRGLGRSLLQKLDNTREALEAGDECRALGSLHGLRGEIRAQCGFLANGRVGIEPALADALLAKIDELAASLHCAPALESPEWRLIDKGFTSGYDATNLSFGGGCLTIRDEPAWAAFWAEHVSIRFPTPELPVIDFETEIVLACLLGWQRDCCSSFVNITDVAVSGGGYRASVERHYEEGPKPATTSPYHIVAATRTDGPVSFFDLITGEPIPEIPPVP